MADFLLSGYSFTMWLIKIFAAITIFLIILAFVTIFSAGEVSTYKLEADTLVQSIFYSVSYLDPLTQKTSLGVIKSNFSIPNISTPDYILMEITLKFKSDDVLKNAESNNLHNFNEPGSLLNFKGDFMLGRNNNQFVNYERIVHYFPNKELFETYEVIGNFKQQIYKKKIVKKVYVIDKKKEGELVFNILVRK